MLKNSLLKISILLTILFSNSHALKKDEIEKEMANRIDNVLLVLKKKDLSKEEKKSIPHKVMPIKKEAKQLQRSLAGTVPFKGISSLHS